MYIINEDKDTINMLRSKYLVLELDTLEFPDGKTTVMHAVIDSEHVPLQEINMLHKLGDLHQNLMDNYHNQNWAYCHDAIDHLRGKFKGEMDSFYDEIYSRILQLEDLDLPRTWTGNLLADQSQDSE